MGDSGQRRKIGWTGEEKCVTEKMRERKTIER